MKTIILIDCWFINRVDLSQPKGDSLASPQPPVGERTSPQAADSYAQTDSPPTSRLSPFDFIQTENIANARSYFQKLPPPTMYAKAPQSMSDPHMSLSHQPPFDPFSRRPLGQPTPIQPMPSINPALAPSSMLLESLAVPTHSTSANIFPASTCSPSSSPTPSPTYLHSIVEKPMALQPQPAVSYHSLPPPALQPNTLLPLPQNMNPMFYTHSPQGLNIHLPSQRFPNSSFSSSPSSSSSSSSSHHHHSSPSSPHSFLMETAAYRGHNEHGTMPTSPSSLPHVELEYVTEDSTYHHPIIFPNVDQPTECHTNSSRHRHWDKKKKKENKTTRYIYYIY